MPGNLHHGFTITEHTYGDTVTMYGHPASPFPQCPLPQNVNKKKSHCMKQFITPLGGRQFYAAPLFIGSDMNNSVVCFQ